MYTMACVKENFRLNPVFTMPLWRRVGFPGGVDIGKHHIPQGVSLLINIHNLPQSSPVFRQMSVFRTTSYIITPTFGDWITEYTNLAAGLINLTTKKREDT